MQRKGPTTIIQPKVSIVPWWRNSELKEQYFLKLEGVKGIQQFERTINCSG